MRHNDNRHNDNPQSSEKAPTYESSGQSKPTETQPINSEQNRAAADRTTEPLYRRDPIAVERERAGAPIESAVNVAQVAVLLVGILYVGIGAVGLSRGGFDDLNFQNQVMGIPHTPLLGLMELVLGSILIFAGALPYAGRWVLIAGGGFLVLWGLLIVIAHSTFNAALGVEALNGWVYIVTGIIPLVVGIAIPNITRWSRSTTASRT